MKKILTYGILLATMACLAFLGAKNHLTAKKFSKLNLPVLQINTENHKLIKSKRDYRKAEYKLGDFSGKCKIRGHGNTTWETRELVKKPYLLKLNEDAPLCGMPSGKKWILLANGADKTMLRNSYAEHLYTDIWNRGLWHPESRFVNLVLNEKYVGMYQLVEKIEMEDDRLGKYCGPDSFLACSNSRMDKDYNFRTKRGYAFSIRSPKKDETIYKAWHHQIQALEDIIFSGLDFTEDKLGKIIDLDSFVDWFLVNDFSQNHDSKFQASCFIYWNSNNHRFYMGPAWDFDLAFGNVSWHNAEKTYGHITLSRGWFQKLWENENFKKAVKKRYFETLPQLKDYREWIKNEFMEYQSSLKLNYRIWWSFGKKKWPHAPGWLKRRNYQAEFEYLVRWLDQRLEWYTAEMEKI